MFVSIVFFFKLCSVSVVNLIHFASQAYEKIKQNDSSSHCRIVENLLHQI